MNKWQNYCTVNFFDNLSKNKIKNNVM